MSGFDQPQIFYSENVEDGNVEDDSRKQVKEKFRCFIREFRVNFFYKYRDELRRRYNLQEYFLEVNLEDLRGYDEALAERFCRQPADVLPLFETAVKEVADEITFPRPVGEEKVEHIQIMVKSITDCTSMRDLKSEQISHLVKVPGIVIGASGIRSKAISLTLQCRSCRAYVNDIAVKPGLDGYQLPRKCNTDQVGRPSCPIDPFVIVPDKCECVDFQLLKMQEAPNAVPNGELPRHMQLYCDRYLCDRVVPGNRVTVTGVYSVKQAARSAKGGSKEKVNIGVMHPYLRVLSVEVESVGPGRSLSGHNVSSEEEELFRNLASRPDIYEFIAKSVAPSIYGCPDIKKAIACLLFGGSRKRLPDGLLRRGDINVLLLGDPGTAKSQVLKFVEQCAPISVYTSGKGSSAAGLTASVTRDPSTRNFVMEGGAMVLADGGVVCIDEFDKMREDDRVATHEAMEQQTISIAKAGITTTLNSRCSVLAAANSVFGRWDETKGEENIDFMPTILSRFDMIFLVKDEPDEGKDTTLARHVMQLHIHAGSHTSADVVTDAANADELNLTTLKRYINYCRQRCGPRLNEAAANRLKNKYVNLRSNIDDHERETGKRSAIPITVRQLEAVVRTSESLAKMRLSPFATEADVEEALRLFQVSTMDAARGGHLAGIEGFTTQEDQELLHRVERQLKRRFVIGSQVSEYAIVQDFVRQKYSEKAVLKVLSLMLRRGEVQHRMQRKMLYRLK